MKKKILYLCLALPSILAFVMCQPSSSSGEVLYDTHCANCHMQNGKGVGELYPDLTTSEFINTGSLEIACFIKNGILAKNEQSARFEQYNMPPNETLSDVDIANILNFMQKEFNDKPLSYNYQNVKEKLNNCN